jgi:hypothetical protein
MQVIELINFLDTLPEDAKIIIVIGEQEAEDFSVELVDGEVVFESNDEPNPGTV